MPRRVIFSPEASAELGNAAEWYDRQQPGLGLKFLGQIESTLDRIVENPQRFRLVSRTIRVARVAVFARYSIYFHVEPEFIGIISVFHASRNPADIKRRLD